MQVKFYYNNIDDTLLKFAVIISLSDNKWVFCKHKDRNTFEIPGGHREAGERIEAAAKRELYEETGALDYTIKPFCAYSVTAKDNFHGEETFGMLYIAEINSFEPDLHNEIEKILITDVLPKEWTYPDIQPLMLREYQKRCGNMVSQE